MPANHNAERICVIFFENASGYVIVAPDQSHPTPTGYERKECRTLRDIDKLTSRLNRQDTDTFSRLMAKDRAQILAKHAEIKSKLSRRMLAVDCGRIERVFIQRMFQYMENKERELAKCEVRGYFQQREFDSVKACTENYGRQGPESMPRMSDRLASVLSR